MNDTDEVAIDRKGMKMPPHPGRPGVGDAELMREELQSVIASPDFARAPIMKRLLSFLVGETAAGRGDQLKAYSVAVDGLGRAPDYDARADSYPRVQVGRLRRMLESYYSATPPSGGLRLTIPSGRYKVALQSARAEAELGVAAPATQFLPARPLTFGWQLGLLLILLLAATAAILRILPLTATTPNAGRERPLLDLAGIEMAKRSDLGKIVRATLLNGLSRSSMYDLRPLRRSGALDPHPLSARYHLSTDLVGGEHPRLFLRLSGVSPERLIWSGDISLPDSKGLDSATLDQALAPAIATIGRVDGLIATHELQDSGGREAIGYGCLLIYHRYRKERTDSERERAQNCVNNSLYLDPGNAELQAAAAQLAIEKMINSSADPQEREALLLTARRHAQISASIDPLNPWGNAVRARIAVIGKTCPQAISFAIRASELQPYDPVVLADSGLFLLDCGDPRAERLIRRAIALDDDPDGRFYMPLLLLAIDRGDKPLVREALARMTPPVFGQHDRFYLLGAVGYAMTGDMARARAAWSQLRKSNAPIARDPQAYLERLGYAVALRVKAIGYLREARLIAS